MEDLKVRGKRINFLTIDWQSDETREAILRFSDKWITATSFLTSRMVGLTEVGKSSLTVEPVTNPPKDWADTFMEKHLIPPIEEFK